MAAATTVPGQLLSAIKGRKFGNVARMFASGVDFQAWSPTGHWVATDPQTVSRIIEVWYSPGANPSVVWSNETTGAKGSATLEIEMEWKIPPDDQSRTLRQIYLLTVKGDKIASARVYCAGLHTEFPEVDLEKQRRAKGIGGVKPAPISAKVIAAKAS